MNEASPHGRSQASLRHQFEVEQDLAKRLRASDRAGRTELFKTLYTELFERVPDHPRLTRRETPEDSQRSVRTQLRLIQPVLGPDKTLVEFAPGDCRLSLAAAPLCKKVIGVDISDQRSPGEKFPANFDLIVYDGYNLPIPDGTVDVAFSYQFLEHLHPDDVGPHFDLVARILRPGGVYVFDTPHRHSGPHDVAALFTNDLVCLHMQEWTYGTMRRTLKAHGFGHSVCYRRGKVVESGIINAVNEGVEGVLGLFPHTLRRKLSKRLYGSVTMMAVKDR